MSNQTFKESVEQKIRESASLVEALESVGAMYGIPAENIIVDDRLNGIRVQGDTILAPDRSNASANTQSIVCAIGAVLDNISQRIDQKLNAYQALQIQQNKKLASQKTPDPSKGEVAGRFFDDNGGEIIAYSSGLVDMDSTPEASRKVAELRASKQIPDYVAEPDKAAQQSSSYFTDEDDIMKGVPTQNELKINLAKAENNIASQIHESADIMHMIDEFDGTTTLGYDLLQSQGFDYVKPTHALIQEAADSLSSAMANTNVSDSARDTVTAADVQHMRFDNTKIIDAIRMMNAAFDKIYGDRENIKQIEPRMIMHTREWKEAIHDLEYQFNCALNINYKPHAGSNVGTYGSTATRRPRMKISKSKGFQLGHMVIHIDIEGKFLDEMMTKRDKKLFGQSMISVFLHEIFHNIIWAMEQYDSTFIATMSTTMMLATSTPNVKARRTIFTNYVNSIRSFDGKALNRSAKRKMIKDLMYISATQYNAKMLKQVQDDVNSGKLEKNPDIEAYIKKLEETCRRDQETMEKNTKRAESTVRRIVNKVSSILSLVSFIACAASAFFVIPLVVFGGIALLSGHGMTLEEYEKYLKEYLNTPNKTEYYCDLFAAIYNLPVTFLLGPSGKSAVRANDIDEEQLKKMTELEKEISQRFFSSYPTDEERCYASLIIAKKTLESGVELDPSIKDYLEWIVKNYSNLENVGIRENYNGAVFNPEEADSLDDHIQRIIDTGAVKVVEQYAPRISKKTRIN